MLGERAEADWRCSSTISTACVEPDEASARSVKLRRASRDRAGWSPYRGYRMPSSDNKAASRRQRHRSVADALQRLSDGEVTRLLATSEPLGSGIGGVRALVEIAGVKVFVKQVPLTERELAEPGERSTANLFDLPMSCHYGIASPGFGVWRETAAHEMTTRLMLYGTAESFPMLYHWRIQHVVLGSSDYETVVEEVTDYWTGTPTVERRLDALARAPATVVLFLEYIPTTLPAWLGEQTALGGLAADEAISMAEAGLLVAVEELQSAGLLHFDAHFGNMLTDGVRVYLTDFGLATSPSFELSELEERFIAANATHDRCHALTRLVDWIITALTDTPDWKTRDERIERISEGDRSGLQHLSPAAAAVVERHASVAAIVNDFYRQLRFDDRHAEYPTDALGQALSGHR